MTVNVHHRRRDLNKQVCLNPLDFLELDPDGFEKRWITRIGGFGLFATKQLRKGDFVLNYRGVHCDDAPSNLYVYAFETSTNQSQCIDATDEAHSGLGRCINDIDPLYYS